MPGTHAQNVSLTPVLLEQLAPASTVTDELGLADADADAVLLVVEEAAGGAEELLPLLHAARPVTAAIAAIPPRASRDRLLLVVVLVLSLFIDGELLCFLFWRKKRAPGVRGLKLRARRRSRPRRP
jgi:hypothetical protein